MALLVHFENFNYVDFILFNNKDKYKKNTL